MPGRRTAPSPRPRGAGDEGPRRLQADCGFDILKESPLGDLSCKSGPTTAVEAWDAALTKAGLPAAERAGTAERLGLVPAPEDEPAGLWRADPKDVSRLIATLSLKAGG